MKSALENPDLVKKFLRKIKSLTPGQIKVMEVCGTHTTAISRYSLRQTLKGHVDFVSGPGCPVCVTDQTHIDQMIAYSKLPNFIIATFGDMLKVPGSHSSLQLEKAKGADVRVVFSPMEAVQIAEDNPGKKVVFIGIGFETTVPIVASSILHSFERGLQNYYVLSLHKTIPTALETLFSSDHSIDGLLLPGHVCAITGSDAFRFIPEKLFLPAVVAGFLPVEILQALMVLLEMRQKNNPHLANSYKTVAKPTGNPTAKNTANRVFKPSTTSWRGLGTIDNSGLEIKPEFAALDAKVQFPVSPPASLMDTKCRCGEVIKGQIKPTQCPLFKNSCTPDSPAGPCMVSGEGACAAFYNYDVDFYTQEDKDDV